jgi:hypothetical protein
MRVGLLMIALSGWGMAAQAQSLQDKMAIHLTHFADKALAQKNCGPLLKDLQTSLQNLDWDQYPNEVLQKEARDLTDFFWRLRKSIHQKLPLFNKDCTLQARDVFHRLRDVDDYLTEFTYPGTALRPEDLDFQKQPVPLSFAFNDGDLMIARGISFFSAIISQISDNKAHFSHTIVVSVAGTPPKTQTVESYVGTGVKAYDIDYALKNENVRLLVLRPKDSRLGPAAATAALHAAALQLPYDYKMDFEDESQMSCVEVPTYAYKKASEGKIKIPLYPAHLVLENEEFLSQLGMKKGPLITPDDLETDPRFDLILDWKDPRLVRDSRQKDAVLAEIVRWLGDLRYEFHDSSRSLFAKYVLLPLRQTPLWGLVRKIPKIPDMDAHIPRTTLGVMTVLDQTAGVLLQNLKKQDEDFKSQHGRPLTNSQLRQRLEDLRAKDFLAYTKGEESLFHKYLRPATTP